MQKDTTIMILTGSKISSELASVFGELPSALVPVNNRPAIFWTLERFINEGFDKFVICVGYKKEKIEYFVKNNFSKRANIEFVEVDQEKKPGNSFLMGLKCVNTGKLLVILGDTLIYDNLGLDYENDAILISDDFKREESYRWALALNDSGFLKEIFDKVRSVDQKIDDKNISLIIGIYFFTDTALLKEISQHITKEKNIEIGEILCKYNNKKPIKLVNYKYWFDFGHLDKYYPSAKKFLQYQSRYFNFLQYDDILNIITKKSKDKTKFNNEIKWYLSIPDELRILAPRVVDYRVGEKPFLTLEYYGYPTLSELYVFGDLHDFVWQNIIDRVMIIMRMFYRKKGRVSKDEYFEMYLGKLESRVNKLIRINPKFKDIFQYETVIINKKEYINFAGIKEKIFSKIKELYSREDNCFIHGDFCFSTILYDTKNGITRIIDPRGSWGKSCYGDIKYDVAKLRHSITGQYDFITNNLFNAQLEGNKIDYRIFDQEKHLFLSQYFDSKIEKYWDLEQIKFIEGLLFLSMLPIHNDYFERQLVMYSIGIQRLNEVINKSR